MARNVAAALRLVLVTDDRLLRGRDVVEVCRAAVRGGVTAVQVRLKEASPRELAEVVRSLLGALSVPILVNDRADVALACRAAGVHVGPADTPVPMVRRISPPGFLVGASVGSPAEALSGRGADYWGVGPFRSTSTKPDAGPAIGTTGLGAVARAGEGRPCVAIGGVRPEDVLAVLQSGGVGVAVVSGILAADDPEEAARAYARRLPPREGEPG